MANFNSMPAPGAADAMAMNGMHPTGLGIEQFDQELNFDEAML